MENEIITANKAQIYAQSIIDGFGINGVPISIKEIKQMLAEAYIAGVSDQWIDATNTPPIDEDVLVDYPCEHGYVVAYYDGEDWYITETGRLIRPTRWTPIPPSKETQKMMRNNKSYKAPQKFLLKCPCCQTIHSVLINLDSNGEGEYRCNCGHVSKIKLDKPNDK